MLIKLGSNISEVSGSILGHTFQRSHGGLQVRNKPYNRKQPSESQYFIRSINLQIHSAWRQLTEENRLLWNRFNKGKLSGQNLFYKFNYVYLSNNLPIITDPYKFHANPFGPELIRNGTFVNSDFWFLGNSWSIPGGKAFYSASGLEQYMIQGLVLPIITNFRLSFILSGIVSPAYINFYCSSSNLFQAPYNLFTFYGNGAYSLNVTTACAADTFQFFGSLAGGSFFLENLSLRQIL